MIRLEHVLPADIEKTSFSIIRRECEEKHIVIPEDKAPVIVRCIHTTADFDYASTLCFSDGVLDKAADAIRRGAHIITDTTMAWSGINKKVLAGFGGEAHCFIADPEVAEKARQTGTTRAAISMEKAAQMSVPLIFAIGNAPTALVALHDLIVRGFQPELIIGVPVGFVNVEASKELIMETEVPYIVNRGRKGGSNVAAAICNAILYGLARS